VSTRTPVAPGPGETWHPADRGRNAPAAGRRRVPLRHRLSRDWPLLVMVLPALALFAVFHYLPSLGNIIAFQDYSPFSGGFTGSPWIGFGNFQRMFTDAGFWNALSNTLTITGFQLVFYFPVPIALALALNGVLSTRLRSLVQGVVYLPHFFSWVLVVSLFQQILGGAGLLAQTLRHHGLQPIDIMTNPDAFIVLVTGQTVWKDAGWGMIVFLAALSTIDPNLYEAAAVDGASRWRRLWHITLPGLRPVIVLLLILRLGDALSVGFEQFILQRQSVGAGAAEVLDTYVYYHGFLVQDFGYGAAVGLFKGVVGLGLILAANRVAHRFGEQGIYQK
jgi:putative aldouronate transport system permease protein